MVCHVFCQKCTCPIQSPTYTLAIELWEDRALVALLHRNSTCAQLQWVHASKSYTQYPISHSHRVLALSLAEWQRSFLMIHGGVMVQALERCFQSWRTVDLWTSMDQLRSNSRAKVRVGMDRQWEYLPLACLGTRMRILLSKCVTASGTCMWVNHSLVLFQVCTESSQMTHGHISGVNNALLQAMAIQLAMQTEAVSYTHLTLPTIYPV